MLNSYGLRPMTEADLTLVWKWRNHLKVRSVSNSQEEIPWSNHLDWFRKAKATRLLFLEDDRTVGVITLNNSGYWSFYLDPEVPSKQGYGLVMLSLVMAYAKKLGLPYIKAQVLSHNGASLKLHKQVGFKVVGRKGQTYELLYSR